MLINFYKINGLALPTLLSLSNIFSAFYQSCVSFVCCCLHQAWIRSPWLDLAATRAAKALCPQKHWGRDKKAFPVPTQAVILDTTLSLSFRHLAETALIKYLMISQPSCSSIRFPCTVSAVKRLKDAYAHSHIRSSSLKNIADSKGS